MQGESTLWKGLLCVGAVPFVMPFVCASYLYDKAWMLFRRRSLEEKLSSLQRRLCTPEVSRSKDALLTWKRGGTVFVLLDRAYDTDMARHLEKHWPYMSFVFIQANVHSIDIEAILKANYARDPYKLCVHNMTESLAYDVDLANCSVRLGKIYSGPIGNVFSCSYTAGAGEHTAAKHHDVLLPGFVSERLGKRKGAKTSLVEAVDDLLDSENHRS